jgi:hypothetical protein
MPLTSVKIRAIFLAVYDKILSRLHNAIKKAFNPFHNDLNFDITISCDTSYDILDGRMNQ